jgi:hypothetical protein
LRCDAGAPAVRGSASEEAAQGPPAGAPLESEENSSPKLDGTCGIAYLSSAMELDVVSVLLA